MTRTILRTAVFSAILAVPMFMALLPGPQGTASAAAPVESGRFVWHDLMAKDVSAAKRFYGQLLGWRFEDTRRGGRPYVLAKLGNDSVAGFVDISAISAAGAQWLSFMAVADVDQSASQVQSAGGKIIITPRELDPVARVAVVADPQGAPLGLARLRRDRPDPAQPVANQFFWDEYLARDAAKALAFYKGLAGYESKVSDTRLGLEYHVLRKTRGRAGLFELPATSTGVEPNWLPYVLVSDPEAMALRVPGLGGRVILPPAPERRNKSLVVIADPDGAVLALQKFPF